MRIAHLSDLHFGDPKTLAEVERCTAFAIDAVVEAGAELAVFSGDSTDHALDVHSPSFVALALGLFTAALFFLIPGAMLDSLAIDSGAANLVNAAQPPLGFTARSVS